ncbi:MAG: hypothetical protein EON91_00160 [Brevundimonas sp.]|uniref:hypothetical protein n=1 Tax=Brevundimonas sp. TaxID=1871086 RepID=UPI00120231B2|nr:hypothetical protein [Brevundimonas sp.]RZJ19678.1 MAG: hypothetical protein EON91_00160 [Brevundimonas sp.]
MRGMISLALLALTAGASAAQAQQATANASLRVVDSYAVSATQPMRLARTASLRPSPTAPVSQPDAPAVIQVTGDAGQSYRVRVPRFVPASQDATVVEGVSVWSANAGDVSDTGMARMDAEGRDTLRVVGRLSLLGLDGVSNAVTALPLSIDYE